MGGARGTRPTEKKGGEPVSTHAVRTTFRPDKVIEVGDAELIDLKRQGLIVSEDAPTDDEPGEVEAPASADTEGAASAEPTTEVEAPAEATKKKGGK